MSPTLYLFSILLEYILSNSHPDQADALHCFGTKHAVRLVRCIDQYSFQVRHNSLIIFLEEFLPEYPEIQHLSKATMTT